MEEENESESEPDMIVEEEASQFDEEELRLMESGND